MKNIKNEFITEIKNCKLILFLFISLLCLLGGFTYFQYHQILNLKNNLFSKNSELFSVQSDNKTLSYLNTLYKKDIEEYREMELNYKEVEDELNKLKQELVETKNTYNSISRGGFEYTRVDKYRPVTVSELNEWIDKRAPENSPFRGKAQDFIMAAKLQDTDVKYFIAHCAVESKWGMSELAETKGNFCGITAYNYDSYNSATSFNADTFAGKLEMNAAWIRENYFDNGKNTLFAMQNNGKPYAQLDDGSKNPDWTPTILDIIYHNNSIN